MEEIARPATKANSGSGREMQNFWNRMDRSRRSIGRKYGRGIATKTGFELKTLTAS